MSIAEELIARYLGQELQAYGLVEWDNGQIIFEGERSDYLIEIKAFEIGKTQRSEN